ncbi:MAG TPA: (2Fe-2S)-binding protein [Chloroflexi bacterium]|nr:(2Fe-2S)-binding protein [Chloroflexota bacterium]
MEPDISTTRKALAFTRRMFLQLGLWISGVASAWGIFQFLSYDPPGEKLVQTVTLDQPTIYLEGSILYVAEVKAWLIRDEDGLYAVSATCTHLGCIINEKDDQFTCPCHGSQFELSGRVLQGPAVSSLPNFAVSLSEDGRVIIDRRVTVPSINRLQVNS